ncbi:MAG: transporter substrate-binding domain-containing protein, partial [Betaproteobacteria bacterium]
LGMSDNGDDDMLMNKLVFTRPYLGMGYVLVTQGKAADMKSLDEFKESGVKVGVSMSTPMDDYLFTHQIPRELYMGSRRMFDAMMKGEIEASMLFSTSLGDIQMDYPKAQFKMVPGYVPMEGLRYNAAWVVRKEDKALLEFIDKGLEELLQNGKIKEIVESYGVPFYPPFAS